jgi:hypothetical protein
MMAAWYSSYVRRLDLVGLKKGRYAEKSTMDLAETEPKTFHIGHQVSLSLTNNIE